MTQLKFVKVNGKKLFGQLSHLEKYVNWSTCGRNVISSITELSRPLLGTKDARKIWLKSETEPHTSPKVQSQKKVSPIPKSKPGLKVLNILGLFRP